MQTLDVLVADDEPLARRTVRRLLARDPQVREVREASDGHDTVRKILERRPDIVFLDVQMPGMDGFEVVAEIGIRHMPPIVFATAHDQHALRAFEISAVDFLLKPFSDSRFQEALQRAKRLVVSATASPAEQLAKLVRYLQENRPADNPVSDRIVLKSAGESVILRPDDIYWLEAQGDYIRVHARERSHLVRETMNSMERRLDASLFVRIHRSAIVNLRQVKRISPLMFGDHAIWLENGRELRVSRTYHPRFAQRLQG